MRKQRGQSGAFKEHARGRESTLMWSDERIETGTLAGLRRELLCRRDARSMCRKTTVVSWLTGWKEWSGLSRAETECNSGSRRKGTMKIVRTGAVNRTR